MSVETLELFPDLKPAHPRPVEPIIRSAEIGDGKRWTLRRAWGAGGCLGVTMLNPSEADSQRDDPTMWEVMKHACRLGFGSTVVTNLYPWITSSPTELKMLKRDSHEAIVENRFIAAKALAPCEKIMFAWGNHATREDVDAFIEHLVGRLCDGEPDEPGPEIVFYCLGKTASGAPIHPLARGKHRIPADQQLIPWP